ncbi:DUF2207 domain-containing protein [Candidatus Saccharibacteria bacterium]|nr:DUF2207 domain-containing protein [Candidatus Saccharibacteria bacterium]
MKAIKFFSGLILTLIISLVPFKGVSASANDFYFKDATFDYYLEKTDSGNKMHVKEVLTAIFPETNQNHGISRAIPYSNQGGKNLTVSSEGALNLTVKRNGENEPISKSEKEDGYYIFYIGKSNTYVHGEQIYTLEYDFENVITEFTPNGSLTWNNNNAAFQELYWDTNGTGWSQKFQSLTANLHIPTDIAKNLKSDTSCYVGRYGSGNNGTNISSRCEVSSSDETTYNSHALNANTNKAAETIITFRTSDLAAGENLTFVVTFEPNTFLVPEPRQSYTLLIITIIDATASILIIVFAVTKYLKIASEKKRYDKSLFVKPEYTPQKNLSVAEAAEVSIKSTKPSFVATLLELAVNHKIEIIKAEKKGILKEKLSWKIKLVDDKKLTSPQEAVLKILNGGTMPAINETFAVEKHRATSSLEAIKKSYHTSAVAMLKNKSLFEEKEKGIGVLTLFAILPALALVFTFSLGIGMIESGSSIFGSGYLTITIIIINFIALIITATLSSNAAKYAKRTLQGIAASKYLEGLKLYITMAEKDRMKFLQSVKGADTSAEGIVKIYEKLLPYACIFGVEESWMEELNKYYKEHPEVEHGWYSGSDYLTYSMFHSMMVTTSSTIISSTSYSSSSSSGGGGGGFSGGGGGGGGGGGW